MPDVKCAYCKTRFFKPQNRVNENKRLGHNFYCSRVCQGIFLKRTSFFFCENINCKVKFEKLRKEIGAHNYCSRSCAAVVNNQKFPRRVVQSRSCRICNKQFSGGNTYCSNPCYKQSRIRHQPHDLIQEIKTTYKQLGRVPAKREIPTLVAACVYAFGSWNNAVRAAGLPPNRSHENRMYKRVMAKAKDGHSCDSISEAIIDNWLTDHDISHERDVSYPETNHKADWRIADGTFVEYFGLVKDSPRYDRDIEIKKALCQQHGIKLIALYPDDLYPQPRLAPKLRTVIA